MGNIKKDINIEKIIIKYEDGTEKEIEKGTVITLGKEKENNEIDMNFEFANCSGKDLTSIIFGVMQMGAEMGLFD
ncbi:hypothetical protein DP130_01505 [Clostridium tetani]|uniref:Uncharacterized protein n=1 Tax=Clostridium tetani TaxID=1513 RepID=A0A4Q0VG87_CLOTA|nr:hypothetical protein [Clostridium tetani]RXI50671.1 hypothetical protein DP130_01505 [Clostridium tetani]RXI54627.1 hypothetical protein DP131_09655 [Clostridium tetani]RXI67012.1 hypothetical protein DQN76_12775 [Clostridium tetani]